jgi:hypothetical protein
MAIDRSFVELNRAATERIRALAASLTDELYAYNKHWITRSSHRNEYLDEVEAALRQA